MTRTLTALVLLATATVAQAGTKPSDAYFVNVGRSTTTQIDTDGAWTGMEIAWNNDGSAPALELQPARDGSLTATIHGDPSSAGTVLGWDNNGTSALVGIEPDEIDFQGRAQPLIGVEPDEIDYFGSCDPQGLVGVEPDEIDLRSAITEDGEVFEMAANYAAYVIFNVTTDRAGTVTWEPTHTLVNENCL